MTDCLANSPFACLEAALKCPNQKPPEDTDMLTPFIQLRMKASGVEITVGNKSAPQNGHHAVIKEMEFGYSERPVCRLKIHDEQGSSFVKFMENLLKDMRCLTPNDYREMELRFGWIKTNCVNNNNMIIDATKSYYLLVSSISCNFDGGKLMYDVELTDLFENHAEARVPATWGGSGDKSVHLKKAIEALFTDTEYQPSVKTVEWLKVSSDGSVLRDDQVTFKNLSGTEKVQGPLGSWRANNLDKLNVLQSWLAKVESEDGKGFIPMYDSTEPGGKLVIKEDPKANCEQTNSPSEACFRQYLVNGGKFSNVISFNPNYKFTFVNLGSSGGNIPSNGGDNNTNSKNPGSDCTTLNAENIPGGGQELSVPVSEVTKNTMGKDASKIENSSNRKQLNAYPINSIEADLVIVGDTSLPNPIFNIGRFISVIFINPYHLFPNANGDVCGDWLAAPLCNEVITNKKWIFRGATHQISEGKFTTTLNLALPVPGVDLNVGDAFGGSGSGGWCPPTSCR